MIRWILNKLGIYDMIYETIAKHFSNVFQRLEALETKNPQDETMVNLLIEENDRRGTEIKVLQQEVAKLAHQIEQHRALQNEYDNKLRVLQKPPASVVTPPPMVSHSLYNKLQSFAAQNDGRLQTSKTSKGLAERIIGSQSVLYGYIMKWASGRETVGYVGYTAAELISLRPMALFEKLDHHASGEVILSKKMLSIGVLQSIDYFVIGFNDKSAQSKESPLWLALGGENEKRVSSNGRIIDIKPWIFEQAKLLGMQNHFWIQNYAESKHNPVLNFNGRGVCIRESKQHWERLAQDVEH